MSNGVFLKLPHKMDVYTKTSSYNAAGQKTMTYSKAGTISAMYQSVASLRRTYPYVANIDEVEFFISYKDAALASYNNRIQNVVDRYGNVIIDYPVEIVNIDKRTGLNGKVRLILLTCRRVTENA
jgi:hypothetical protein